MSEAMTPAAKRAYEQGRAARREGVPKKQNPFNWLPASRGPGLSAWWEKGWQEQDRRERERSA